jgi:hypothetical protein
VSRRERRTAENEVSWRQLNELVPPDEFGLMFCECGLDDCSRQFRISSRAYELIRSQPRWFAVVPGHERPDVEAIVERHDDYVIVEKIGEAGELADETDPRN